MAIATHHPFRSREAKQEYLHLYDHLAEQWPAPSEARVVDTSFGQTFIRIQGPVDAAPLVLLPGDTETSLSWLPVIEVRAPDAADRFELERAAGADAISGWRKR